MDQTRLEEPLEAFCAERIPAPVEAAPVAFDVFGVGVERPVGRGVGDILEEGGVRMGLGVPPELICGLVADGVGEEELAWGGVDALVVAGQGAGW